MVRISHYVMEFLLLFMLLDNINQEFVFPTTGREHLDFRPPEAALAAHRKRSMFQWEWRDLYEGVLMCVSIRCVIYRTC